MNLITRLKDSFYYHRQITIDDELEDCEPDDTYVVTAFALVAEKVIPRILSTPCLEDLSGFASITLLLETTMILDSCLWLSSTDGINIIRTTSDVDLQYVRDMVLHEVFIPMEPSLIQLRHSLDISYLEVEDDDPKQFFIGLMNDSIRKWKHDGASTWRRGRLLLQTLERGGFLEGFEQELLHSASAEKGRKLKLHSCDFLNLLGMNSPRPELITQNRSTTLQAANLFQ
ncbi:hypothetical protein BLNAU_5197 [Blattamonas nauphoetae]|uniref:Uncharacterized protein n=1 Tax=Blattamonas nauphoetae TaxID=2049346 RepID=A0ABQ9Y7N8_9EUKA|nr:hypothetical protein BLNAU_5197 [Blattamonas nauphoetae]